MINRGNMVMMRHSLSDVSTIHHGFNEVASRPRPRRQGRRCLSRVASGWHSWCRLPACKGDQPADQNGTIWATRQSQLHWLWYPGNHEGMLPTSTPNAMPMKMEIRFVTQSFHRVAQNFSTLAIALPIHHGDTVTQLKLKSRVGNKVHARTVTLVMLTPKRL